MKRVKVLSIMFEDIQCRQDSKCTYKNSMNEEISILMLRLQE